MDKIRKMLVHNTFRRFFLTYLLLFVLLATAAVAAMVAVMQYERGKKNQQACEANAEQLALSVSMELNAIHRISSSLRSAVWVNKLMAEGDIFKSEFTILRQKEISMELVGMAASNTLVKEIAVLYPKQSLTVAPSGWWDTDEFLRRVGRVYDMDSAVVEEGVRHVSGGEEGILFTQNFCCQSEQTLLFTQPLGSVGAPEAVALILLDKARIREVFSQYFTDELNSIELVDTKLGLLVTVEKRAETGAGSGYSVRKPCSTLLVDVVAHYSISSFQLDGRDIAVFLCLESAVCLLSVGLSYLLASRNYRPLNRLLARLHLSGGGGRSENEYETIGDSFDTLHAEHQDMQKRAELYYNAAQQAVLLRLLKGYFSSGDITGELQEYGIPFTDEFFYAVLLVTVDGNDGAAEAGKPRSPAQRRIQLTAACFDTAKALGLEAFVADSMDRGIAVILHWDAAPNAKLPREYAVRLGDGAEVSASGIHRGIIGISVAFQEAVEAGLPVVPFELGKTRPGKQERMYYYPTDWERQFIEALKSGGEEVALSILTQLERENEARNLAEAVREKLASLLMETVTRVAYEMEIPLKNGAEANFAALRKATGDLCRRIQNQNNDLLQDVKNGIRGYVNQNYTDPGVTLKSLGALYRLSAPSVSRIFKEATGINFSEYVTTLRLEKAKELIRIYGCDVGRIATQVGYDSAYSFKRAFLRVEGMKPAEYETRVRGETDGE